MPLTKPLLKAMTRDEHVAKAQALLAGEFHPSTYPGGEGYHSRPTADEVAEAQVHAILALAVPLDDAAPRWSWLRRAVAR